MSDPTTGNQLLAETGPLADSTIAAPPERHYNNNNKDFYSSSSDSELNDEDDDDEFNPSSGSGRKSKKRTKFRRRHSIASVPAQKPTIQAALIQQPFESSLAQNESQSVEVNTAVISNLQSSSQPQRRPRSNSLNVKPARSQTGRSRKSSLSTSTSSPMKRAPMLFNPVKSQQGSSSSMNTSLQKPSYSYASLIGLAIMNSEDQRARLSSIYQWITSNFIYYKMDHGGWQNSIRHNLTVNKCFVKDVRKGDPPGKGSFWTIHEEYKRFFESGLLVDGGCFTCGNQKVNLRTGNGLNSGSSLNASNESLASVTSGSGAVLSPFSQIKRSSFSRRPQPISSNPQRNSLTVRFGNSYIQSQQQDQEQDEYSNASSDDGTYSSAGESCSDESECDNYELPEYTAQMPDIKTPGSPYFSVFTSLDDSKAEKMRAVSPPAFKAVLDDEMDMTSESLYEYYSNLVVDTNFTNAPQNDVKTAQFISTNIGIINDTPMMQLDDESPNISCLSSIVPSLMTSHEDLFKLREMQHHNAKQLHDADLKVSFESQAGSSMLFGGASHEPAIAKTAPLFSSSLSSSSLVEQSQVKNNYQVSYSYTGDIRKPALCDILVSADTDFLRHSSMMNSLTFPELSDLFYGVDILEAP